MSCRGAAAAVIVFDITSKDSFAKAKSWIKELQRQVHSLSHSRESANCFGKAAHLHTAQFQSDLCCFHATFSCKQPTLGTHKAGVVACQIGYNAVDNSHLHFFHSLKHQ